MKPFLPVLTKPRGPFNLYAPAFEGSDDLMTNAFEQAPNNRPALTDADDYITNHPSAPTPATNNRPALTDADDYLTQ